MKRQPFRATVAILGMVGLLGISAPAARATTTFSILFTATATLDGPLGYPCTGPGSNPGGTGWAFDFGLCPLTTQPTIATDLPLPGELVPTNFHTDWHHNTRGVTITEITCLNAALNTLKPKAPSEVGPCNLNTITGSLRNTVSGYCGLSGGQVTLNAFFRDTVSGTTNTVILDLHFTGDASVFVVTGHWTKPSTGQSGKVRGTVVAFPPFPDITPGSCLGKTAITFTLAGAVLGTPV